MSVSIIGQRHSEEFWFGPGLHVTRLATMKGKHHGGVYPATVGVSMGYTFFLQPYLFIYGLCYHIMAGFTSGTRGKWSHDKLVACSLSLEGFRNQWRLNETAISAHSGDN